VAPLIHAIVSRTPFLIPTLIEADSIIRAGSAKTDYNDHHGCDDAAR